MSVPPAAIAVVRASLEDAHLADLLQRPGMTAQRITQALAAEGWTITRTPAASEPQQAA
ncbi:hypothetical protein [Streptomyces sp. NPDC048489]|uniref:hypothetical protein n=1 Tax=Streptomyces sp. NPDC048489 TaxID=3154504 RepID=UPI00344563C5